MAVAASLHTSFHSARPHAPSHYPALRMRPPAHTSLHTSRPAPLCRYVMGWDSGTWVDSKGNAASALSFKQVRRRSALESSPASPLCISQHACISICIPHVSPRAVSSHARPPLHLPSTPPACPPKHIQACPPLFTPPSLPSSRLPSRPALFTGPLRVYDCERRHQLRLGVHLELYRPDAVHGMQHVHGVRRHKSMQ